MHSGEKATISKFSALIFGRYFRPLNLAALDLQVNQGSMTLESNEDHWVEFKILGAEGVLTCLEG